MNSNRGKTAFLILALVGSSYYGISKYRSLTPSAAINNGTSDESSWRHRSVGERSPESREKRHQEFAKLVNLTPAQEAQMSEIHASDAHGRDRWTSMAAVLTPQQRQAMSAARQERRDRGAKATLSKSDFERYRQKREQMRASRGGQNGGGHRGGRGHSQ